MVAESILFCLLKEAIYILREMRNPQGKNKDAQVEPPVKNVKERKQSRLNRDSQATAACKPLVPLVLLVSLSEP